MAKLILMSLLCVSLINWCNSVIMPFNCQHFNVNCDETGSTSCDLSTGSCNCKSGYSDYNCKKYSTSCSGNDPCGDNGDCYIPEGGSSPACLCHEDYYGASCQDKRVVFECFPTYLVIKHIETHASPFVGKIYVSGIEQCAFSGSDLTITSSNTPAGVTPSNGCNQRATYDAANNLVSVEMTIRYSSSVQVKIDRRLTLKCDVTDGKVWALEPLSIDLASSAPDSNDVVERFTEVSKSIGDERLYAKLIETKTSVTSLNRELKIGENTFIEITLEIGGYSHYLLKSLKINNGLQDSDANYGEISLITDQCLNSVYRPLVDSISYTDADGKKSTFIGYNAFSIKKTTDLVFIIELVLCIDETEASCHKKTCDFSTHQGLENADSSIGHGKAVGARRRRQAGDQQPAVTTEKMELAIKVGEGSPPTALHIQNKMTDCFGNLMVLLPLIILILLLLLSLLTAFYFGSRLQKYQQLKKALEKQGYINNGSSVAYKP